MTRALGPLHGLFRIADRVLVPMLEHGAGALLSNPLTGHLMVLRTRGRRSGLLRSAPVGYVVLDGQLYICAGFGPATAWYRNVLADPSVDVVLPGRTLRGTAVPVTTPEEWVRAYRSLIASLGVIGHLTVGGIRSLDDADLLAAHGALPLIRITPTAVVAGAFDPGGRAWLVPWLIAAILAVVAAARRPARPGARGAAP